MKLLLAVDLSKDSKIAINLLRQLTWPAGSTLTLLHVATVDDQKRATPSPLPKNKKSRTSKSAKPDIHAELRRLEKLLTSETLKVQSLVVKGIPGQEILMAIRKKNIDMVFLGSRGRSRISGLLMGSVSEWVLNDAPCSVFIGRPTGRKIQASRGMNVLLATDGSSDAWKAVNVLQDLALPAKSHLMLLHVIKKHVYETGQCVDRTGKSQAEFAKLAKDVCRDRGSVGVGVLKDTRKALDLPPHITIKERMALGHEAKEILRAARQEKVELVIMGSKGMTGLRRLFMGSVSHTVSQHAPCSVLVVRSSTKS